MCLYLFHHHHHHQPPLLPFLPHTQRVKYLAHFFRLLCAKVIKGNIGKNSALFVHVGVNLSVGFNADAKCDANVSVRLVNAFIFTRCCTCTQMLFVQCNVVHNGAQVACKNEFCLCDISTHRRSCHCYLFFLLFSRCNITFATFLISYNIRFFRSLVSVHSSSWRKKRNAKRKEPCSLASNWKYTREITKKNFYFDLFQLENRKIAASIRLWVCFVWYLVSKTLTMAHFSLFICFIFQIIQFRQI